MVKNAKVKKKMRHFSTLNVDVDHFAGNVECDISSNFQTM